ncbi:MAG: hypothetical protein U0Y82_09940 [Thermoleophilia bacterium]
MWAGCLIATCATAATAGAATPAQPPTVQVPAAGVTGGFYNYDFDDTGCAPASGTCTNVDWPVTMVFQGPRVSVSSVRTLLGNAGYGSGGSTENASVSVDGATFQWVADGGRKRSVSSTIDPLPGAPRIRWFSYCHIRLYAPSAGYFGAAAGTHYVVATTHYDINEVLGPTAYGWSDTAAKQVAADLVSRRQITAGQVAANTLPLANPEALRAQGNHTWQNDGNATVITIG